MTLPPRTYGLFPPPPTSIADELREHPPLFRQLFYNRGLPDASSVEKFLGPSYDNDLHDPFLLTDMERAVERLLRALRTRERIVVYTDYDCDGIPGGVLFHDFLTEIGHTNFENFIPHRHNDGYGLSAEAMPMFHERGASLIITIDCGITDREAVEKANELGIDVIITDHHEVGEALPPAYAVVNPKRDDAYPFKGICGTAVAFKLAQATLTRGKEDGTITLKDGMEKWWLDLVGLATIADMVPLVDENRVFARYGLQVLRKSRRPGLQHLLRRSGANQRYLTEDDIGFTIAPRINAASRMDDPEDAFHMLRTRDEKEAGMRAEHLEKLNNARKGVVASMVREAKERLAMLPELPPVIVMGNIEWRPSLVGLVANSIAEEFCRPTFLWGRDGKGVLKGSCRSGGVMSIVRLMEAAKDAFLTFGGHHASGGFSVSQEGIHTLPEALTKAFHAAEGTQGGDDGNVLVDAEIDLDDITDELIRLLDRLAPFGVGNEKPLFKIRGIVPDDVTIFGKTKNHTKLRLRSARARYDAISFFKLPEQFSVKPEKGKRHDLLAHIERSHFMGRLDTRLRLIDVM